MPSKSLRSVPPGDAAIWPEQCTRFALAGILIPFAASRKARAAQRGARKEEGEERRTVQKISGRPCTSGMLIAVVNMGSRIGR